MCEQINVISFQSGGFISHMYVNLCACMCSPLRMKNMIYNVRSDDEITVLEIVKHKCLCIRIITWKHLTVNIVSCLSTFWSLQSIYICHSFLTLCTMYFLLIIKYALNLDKTHILNTEVSFNFALWHLNMLVNVDHITYNCFSIYQFD